MSHKNVSCEVLSIFNKTSEINPHQKKMSSSVNELLKYSGILVPVRTSFGLRRRGVKRTTYQRKVDVDMLNAVKSVLADVSNANPSSEQTLFTAFSICTSTLR